MKFTDTAVAKLIWKGRDEWHSATQYPALNLRVTRASKTFSVQLKRGGRSRRIRLGTFPDMSCDDALAAAIAAKGKSRDVATVEAALASYLARRSMLRKSTLDEYRRLGKTVLAPLCGRLLNSLSTADLANFHADLRSTPYIANRALGLIRTLLKDADLPDPSRRVRKYPEQHRRTSLHDLEAWWTAVDALPNQTRANAFKFLLFTGWRMSDALSLRWDEVDLPGKRVHARHLKAVPGGRTFPISKSVVALLQDQLAVKRNEFVFPGNGPGGRTMDLRAKTVPGTRHDLRRIFTAACLNVGLSDTVTKFLRGDAASSMLAKYSADVKLDHLTVELVAEHLRKGEITFKTAGYQEFTYSSD